jgi:hypothetical protein
VEVRALEVGHSRKTLLPYGVLLIPDQKKRDRQCGGSGAVVLTQRGEAMCAIISMPVSGSLSMTDPDHGLTGSKGIITLTSHLSKSWTLDSQQR